MNTATLEPKSSVAEADSEAGLAASGSSAVKRSSIYLAAWIAAEKALPKESLRLIEAYDALHAEHRKAGWPTPVPESLLAASKKIDADPLASIAFELRRKCNMEAHEEWRAENRSASQ